MIRRLSLLLAVFHVVCWSLQQPIVSRRQIVEASLLHTGILIVNPNSASAARGAAELDLEFYMRDLIGGNQRQGSVEASPPPVLPPPRILQGKLPPILLNEKCSPDCIPCQVLIQQLQQQRIGQDATTIAVDIARRVDELREKSKRGFLARAPWGEETIHDQYYFDVTSYALWRTAADLLPNYLDRDRFVRTVGRRIYDKMISEGLIMPIPSKSTGGRTPLSETIPATTELLEAFKSSGFIKDYKIRGDDSKDATDPLFDELDDESLMSAGSVDCLLSIFEPATLGADLQITGEQSRFGPDFVGTTLAALWESIGVRSSWEIFFVDPEYRPNPKDYSPNEQLIQYTLTKSKA